jgi:hypothetical protein
MRGQVRHRIVGRCQHPETEGVEERPWSHARFGQAFAQTVVQIIRVLCARALSLFEDGREDLPKPQP